MEGKYKEWIAIAVCICTGVFANIQSFGNESTQKGYHEEVYDTTKNQRSAILDVREKIDYLFRRMARLEDASRILPPGPLQATPPQDADAGSTDPDVIEEKDVEVTPEPEPKQNPFEMEKNGTPKWDPIEQSLPSYETQHSTGQ